MWKFDLHRKSEIPRCGYPVPSRELREMQSQIEALKERIKDAIFERLYWAGPKRAIKLYRKGFPQATVKEAQEYVRQLEAELPPNTNIARFIRRSVWTILFGALIIAAVITFDSFYEADRQPPPIQTFVKNLVERFLLWRAFELGGHE